MGKYLNLANTADQLLARYRGRYFGGIPERSSGMVGIDYGDLTKLIGKDVDPAHGWNHIDTVRREAYDLAKKYNPDSLKLIDDAALYHDIGLGVDRDLHELIGSEMVANNDILRRKWGDQLPILVDAIREHRASTGNPQHIVGQILSDADRLGAPDGNRLSRSVLYFMDKNPGSPMDVALLNAAKHIEKKFGEGSYGRRTYFPETEGKIVADVNPVIQAFKEKNIRRLAELAGINL